MMGLGVFAGDTVEIVKTGPGPVIFLKGATRIAVGCGMAQAVLVEPGGADAPPKR